MKKEMASILMIGAFLCMLTGCANTNAASTSEPPVTESQPIQKELQLEETTSSISYIDGTPSFAEYNEWLGCGGRGWGDCDCRNLADSYIRLFMCLFDKANYLDSLRGIFIM